MNSKEYEEYKARVQEFSDKEKITEFALEQPDRPLRFTTGLKCDCCKDTRQGPRTTVVEKPGNLSTMLKGSIYFVCDRCLYYLSNGRLPDVEMKEMEES